MKPQHLKIHVDKGGDLWAVENRPNTGKIKHIRNITEDVLACLVADVSREPGGIGRTRVMRFPCGTAIEFRAEVVKLVDADGNVEYEKGMSDGD